MEVEVEGRLGLVGLGQSWIRMITMIFRCLWGLGFDCLVGLGGGLALSKMVVNRGLSDLFKTGCSCLWRGKQGAKEKKKDKKERKRKKKHTGPSYLMLKPYYEWLGCGQSRVQETSSSCRRRIRGFLRGRATFFRGGFVLVFLSLSSPLCKRAREADFTERSEEDVVSHSNVDSGLQDDEEVCNG